MHAPRPPPVGALASLSRSLLPTCWAELQLRHSGGEPEDRDRAEQRAWSLENTEKKMKAQTLSSPANPQDVGLTTSERETCAGEVWRPGNVYSETNMDTMGHLLGEISMRSRLVEPAQHRSLSCQRAVPCLSAASGLVVLGKMLFGDSAFCTHQDIRHLLWNRIPQNEHCRARFCTIQKISVSL